MRFEKWQTPITFRPAVPGFKERIDRMARERGWSRTTYILFALGQQLLIDEEIHVGD